MPFPIDGHTVGVDFQGTTLAPKYVKIEGFSQDSLKRYTIVETDSNWNSAAIMGLFAGAMLKYTLKSYQIGGVTVTSESVVRSTLKNVDTLYVTVWGNNTGEDHIGINKIWMYVQRKPARNVLLAAGGGDTAYQKMNFKGAVDMYDELDMKGDTIRNIGLAYRHLKHFGSIGNFDTTTLFPGAYTYNNSTPGTSPGGVGTVYFSVIGDVDKWTGAQGATMLAITNSGLVYTRGFTGGGAWSAWTLAGGSGGSYVTDVISNKADTLKVTKDGTTINYQLNNVKGIMAANYGAGVTVNATATTYGIVNGRATAFMARNSGIYSCSMFRYA